VGWRSIFWINPPLALAAAVLALRYMPESRDEEARGLDWLGAALAGSGLAAVTWGLTAGPDRGWLDGAVLAALIGGAGLLAAFVVSQARERAPMMPLSLYRSRAFSGANILTLLLYFALGGALFFLPFDLIRVHGWSAAEAGAALLPFSLIMGLFSSFAGRLADRIGPRLPLTIGPILAGLGLWGLGLPDPGSSYWTGVLPALIVTAVGMTLAVGPLTATVMGAVEPRHVGVASGVNNAVARVAGLLAIAGLGVLLSAAFALAYDGPEPREALSAVMAGEAEGSREAFHTAFRAVMTAAGLCAAAGGLAAFFTVPKRQKAA
jgi:MFS family permease